MILGIYYLSTEKKNSVGEGIIFANTDEVMRAYALGQVHPHTIVGISTKNYPTKQFPHQGILITNVGKIILNSVLPDNMIYLNDSNSVGTIHEDNIVKAGEDPRKVIAN
jgi:DNA-directed RNA polymerase subunit beta'